MSNQTTGWGETSFSYNASFESTSFGYLKPAEHVFRSQSAKKSKEIETVVIDSETENANHATTSTDRMGELSADLKPNVHESGDVTYSDEKGELLRDSSDRVSMLRTDEEAVEIGLKLAADKYREGTEPTELEVGGSDEFKRLTVQIAAREGIDVKFSDPQMEAERVQIIEAQEHAAASIERMERIQANSVPEPEQPQETEQLTAAEMAALYGEPEQPQETEQLTAAEMAALSPDVEPAHEVEAQLTPAEQQALDDCHYSMINSNEHGYER